MIDEPQDSSVRPLGSTATARQVAAWFELLGCEAEIERMLEGLEAVRAGLSLPSAKRGGRTQQLPGPVAELDTTLGCLADHLLPAREVVRRFEAAPFPGEEAAAVAAWVRRLHASRAAGHERVRSFLADARGDALPALRHLLGCPLCERLARIVLFGFLPDDAPHPKRRRRRRRKPLAERQLPRGEGG
jgi:hypothetical protein